MLSHIHSNSIFQVASLLTTITGVLAASFDPKDCVGKITEFTNCNNADRITKKCSSVTGKQESIDCFCTQELFDAYVGCKGELRQCALSNSFDATIQTEIDNWHDACDPYLPKDFTTPSFAGPTRTLDQDTCLTIAESCFQLSQATDACSSSHTVPADLTSCRCESSVVSLASVCLIDGVSSCVGENVTTSDIWEFRECSAVNASIHITEQPTDPTKTMGGSTQVDAGSASSLNFGPSSTTTTTSSSEAVPRHKLGSSLWTCITVIAPYIIFN